jgi:hypothetical protein
MEDERCVTPSRTTTTAAASSRSVSQSTRAIVRGMSLRATTDIRPRSTSPDVVLVVQLVEVPHQGPLGKARQMHPGMLQCLHNFDLLCLEPQVATRECTPNPANRVSIFDELPICVECRDATTNNYRCQLCNASIH